MHSLVLNPGPALAEERRMYIDPKSNVPIYRQILDEVRSAIEVGVYKPGERLPSLRALALDIHVNPNTVQRAYDELEREGTVVSRRGIGVFVADHQQLSAHGAVEKETARSLNDVIRAALKSEISVDRLRSLFEHALSQSRRIMERKRK